ncbi:Extracellular metalloprotease 1 [Grifola frondosa]|uniref:Extracellular metalloprotease 1 n=1 Tax=Grifola frondosa TaxID=5627 RepID=A0A1C7MIK6_GRIFR|nr:Extracellular metalloprotease 1 [Grifola frondosa]
MSRGQHLTYDRYFISYHVWRLLCGTHGTPRISTFHELDLHNAATLLPANIRAICPSISRTYEFQPSSELSTMFRSAILALLLSSALVFGARTQLLLAVTFHSMIADQITAMNEDYSGSGLTFVLAGTTRTVNQQWFSQVGPDSTLQMTMKQQLRQGGANAFNVYTFGYVQFSLHAGPLPTTMRATLACLGSIAEATVNFLMFENCSVRTLTHEAGHWVGLYHTFMGSCAGAGDLVDDTPPEASPASGCPSAATPALAAAWIPFTTTWTTPSTAA